MANTYTLISSVTVGSGGANSIEFTSIPSTYTDLKVILSLRNDLSAAYDNIVMTFNGSTSTYNERYLLGNGSSASSGTPGGSPARSSNIQFMWQDSATATSNTFNNAEIYIPNYSGSNYKSVSMDSVIENNATSAATGLSAGLWSTTSAITSVKFTPNNGTVFVQYSTAYIYGIKNS